MIYLSQSCKPIPFYQILNLPASLAAGDDYMTQSWPIICKRKSAKLFLKKIFHFLVSLSLRFFLYKAGNTCLTLKDCKDER